MQTQSQHLQHKAQNPSLPHMNLRDHFAAEAMVAICTNIPRGAKAVIAREAYEMADAMLAERNRENGD